MTALFHGNCLLCGLHARGSNICAGCRADLPWIRRPCRCCGAPRQPGRPPGQCGQCPLSLGAVDRCRTALVYEYPVDRLIMRAKFQARPECARALGELLSAYLRGARICGGLDAPDALLPVPLHRVRLARRGFNQAAEIAHPVARTLRLPSWSRRCVRSINTVEQTTLTGRARRANIRGAFDVVGDVAGARIAIVDDVLTTGSTVNELARALRAAGAAAVEVWAVARSVRQPSG